MKRKKRKRRKSGLTFGQKIKNWCILNGFMYARFVIPYRYYYFVYFYQEEYLIRGTVTVPSVIVIQCEEDLLFMFILKVMILRFFEKESREHCTEHAV